MIRIRLISKRDRLSFVAKPSIQMTTSIQSVPFGSHSWIGVEPPPDWRNSKPRVSHDNSMSRTFDLSFGRYYRRVDDLKRAHRLNQIKPQKKLIRIVYGGPPLRYCRRALLTMIVCDCECPRGAGPKEYAWKFNYAFRCARHYAGYSVSTQRAHNITLAPHPRRLPTVN